MSPNPTAHAEKEAHRQSTETSIADIASFLSETLGASLTAHMCGVDRKTRRRWTKGAKPGEAKERRLRAAYQAFHLLQSRDSQHTVRAWFMGLNPQLDDESPVEAIREDRLRDVNVAARAFVLGG
ncbi:MAG: hypothetical protein ACRDQZ_20795 [Mycobacteriales bacterium]